MDGEVALADAEETNEEEAKDMELDDCGVRNRAFELVLGEKGVLICVEDMAELVGAEKDATTELGLGDICMDEFEAAPLEEPKFENDPAEAVLETEFALVGEVLEVPVENLNTPEVPAKLEEKEPAAEDIVPDLERISQSKQEDVKVQKLSTERHGQ
jgi:hypothetical protein